eukprot:12927093-Prorocentrum_lima.AAC.1
MITKLQEIWQGHWWEDIEEACVEKLAQHSELSIASVPLTEAEPMDMLQSQSEVAEMRNHFNKVDGNGIV